MRLRCRSVRCLTLSLLIALGSSSLARVGVAQDAAAQSYEQPSREQLIADRFLQVLLRRPRMGTSLDRVYGYYVQTGTLDELIERQEKMADAGDDAGNRRFVIGLLNLQRGKDAEAAVALEKAEQLLPEDAMVSFFLGKAFTMVGRGDAATKAYERAIDRKPARNEALPVFTQLGRLYQRAQENEKALNVWKRLEATFPGDTRVSEQIAATLAGEGQLDAALERYEELAERTQSQDDFRSVGYQIAAAEIKRKLGNDDEALTDFEALLRKLRPSSWLYADVRRRIEAGFLRTGNYAQLADYYAKLVEANPDEIPLRLRLGQTLASAGRLNEAEESLRQTIELAGEDTEVRLALVDVLNSAGKAGLAASQLEILAELDPHNPDTLVRLGNAWLDDNTIDLDQRRENAADAWHRLGESRFDDAVVLAQVGDLMRRIDRSEDAIAYYRKAIALEPEQPQYREYLGEFFHRGDRGDDALEVWAAIAEGDRRTRPNLIRLAEIYNTFEHSDLALSVFGEAAEMDPTFSERVRYANLLMRAEQYDESLVQLDLAETACETPEETEQVLRARIGVYASSGTLDEQIAESRTQFEGMADADTDSLADAHRTLAIMLDAASRVPEAIESIERAVEVIKKARPFSSDDAMVLSINAELYRKGARYGDAVDVYRILSKQDSRYRSNYLKRIAGLQMQLGQTEEALATAAELIADQPGNPESYRFYADQCFRLGRAEEGIEKLRQALRSAPRDRHARSALAAALALRFRTDEAIELYWQLLVEIDELDDQEPLVKSLAELYERKGDFDRLLSRLELHGREESDARTAVLLIATAHQSVNDFGSAQQTLEPLLAENPRDAQLLERMVVLAKAADDNNKALDYQNQLVALADTVEQRRLLLQLMVDTGQIDQAEAMTQQIKQLQEPFEMIRLIDGMMRRDERETAVRLCDAVLENHPDLWEVRVRLAGLFILGEKYDRAATQLDAVEAMTLEADELSELKKVAEQRKKSSSGTQPSSVSSASIFQSTGRLNQSYRSYELARTFAVGRYSSSRYSSGNRQSLTLKVDNFAQAKYLTLAMRMAIASKLDKFDEFIDEQPNVNEAIDSDDVEDLWTALEVSNLRGVMGPSQMVSQSNGNSEDAKSISKLMWRLAELDSESRMELVTRLISIRMSLRNPQGNQPTPLMYLEPLEPSQLAMIARAIEQFTSTVSVSPSQSYYSSFTKLYHDELIAAGADEKAEQLLAQFSTQPHTLQAAIDSIQFYASTQKTEELRSLLTYLEKELPQWLNAYTDTQASQLQTAAWAAYSVEDLAPESKDGFANLAIAGEAMRAERKKYTRQSTSQKTGVVSTHQRVNNNYQRVNIEVPFSDAILPSSFAQSAYQAMKFATNDEKETDHALEFLDRPMYVFAEGTRLRDHEYRLRSALSAFARWWARDLPAAYRRIVKASEAIGKDDGWQIERARMAAELDRPALSLAALDSITPLDQQTLRVRELAAINLASKLGKLDRAKVAAQRLFGLRLDNATELALADQLNRLGMREMAAAVLQRNQRRGGQSVSDLLQLANAFDGQGDRNGAAEVAFKALQKINSGNESNSSYYRRRATEILKKANRLDGLLKQAERRVANAPNSVSLKTELAQLYVAAGREQQAKDMLDSLAKQNPKDGRTLWSMGEQLSSAGKHAEAVEKYMTAIEKRPDTLSNQNYYTFERAVYSAKMSSKVYERFMKLNLKKFDPYLLGRLAAMYRRESREPTPESKAFVDRLMREAAPDALGGLFRDLSRQAGMAESDGVQDAIRRVIGDRDLYLVNCQFWNSVSFGTGGKLNSPLTVCLQAIAADEELEDFAREQIAIRLVEDSTRYVASWLLLTLDASEGDLVELTLRVQKLMDESGSGINQYQWWQLGQLFLEQKPLATLALKTLLHAKSHRNQVTGLSFSNSIDALLTDAYEATGDKAIAREFLREAYSKVDNSEQNTYNPGYGDYQDLNTFLGFAKKLSSLGFPMDAVLILNRSLAQPERFTNAQRWGGGDRKLTEFKKELSNAIELIDEEAIEQFLDFASESDELVHPKANQVARAESSEDEVTLRFAVIPLMHTDNEEAAVNSLAELVMTKAAQSASGRKLLNEFAVQLKLQQASYPEDWSLLVADVMMSLAWEHAAGSDKVPPKTEAPAEEDDPPVSEIVALLETLIERLPEWSDDELLPSSGLVDLASPALMAMQSPDRDVVKAGVELCDYAIEAAKRAERNETAQALVMAKMKLDGDRPPPEQLEGNLTEFLDWIVPAEELTNARNMEAATECIHLAESAAEAKSYPVLIEAIRRALRLGPPLRVVKSSSSSGSAFMMATQNRSSSSSSSDASDQDLDALTMRLEPLIAQMRSAMNAKDSQTDSESANPKSLDVAKAYDAFREIVFPKQRKGEIFPYLAKLHSSRLSGLKRDKLLNPPSVLAWLVELAVASDRLEELAVFARQYKTNPPSKHYMHLMRVLIAVAQDDSVVADSELLALSESIGWELDESGLEIPMVYPPPVTLQELDRLNVVLHAAWAMESKMPGNQTLTRLKLKTVDEVIKTKARTVLNSVVAELLIPALSSDSVRDEQAKQIAEQLVTATRSRYSNYSGSYGESRVKEMRERLIPALAKSKRYDLVGSQLHSLAQTLQGLNKTSLPILPLVVKTLPDNSEARYRTLINIVFGDDPKSPPLTWAAQCLMLQPPGVLSKAANRYEAAASLPIGGDSFPITSTSLWIAESAAQCGKSAELIERLKPHVEKPGDETDAFVALAMLAQWEKSGTEDDGTRDEIRQTMEAVMEELVATIPKSNVKTPMLINSSLLAARCLDHAEFNDLAQKAWEPLLIHARRRSLGLLVSYYAATATDNGFDAAVGASRDTKFQHFVNVQMPYSSNPIVPQTEPMLLRKDDSIAYAGGSDMNVLMLKYPLVGDFVFSHRNVKHRWSFSDNVYGGTAYGSLTYNSTAKVTSLIGRKSVVLPCKTSNKNDDNFYELRVDGDDVVMVVNGEDTVVDHRTNSMPFAGIQFKATCISEVADIQVSGNPIIPREVSLIEEELRGWSCPILFGRILDPHLPLETDEDADKVKASRQAAAESAEEKMVWFVDRKSGELRTGGGSTSYNPGSQRHIVYLRPLLDRETIDYEFYYEPGKIESHPTIGRVAILMREAGAKLRWLTKAQSLESDRQDALHEIKPDASLGKFPPIDLNANDWNQVKLIGEESTVAVEVNGKTVGRFEVSMDRRFGILGEEDRQGRIRNIRLRGDWPEKLPKNLIR